MTSFAGVVKSNINTNQNMTTTWNGALSHATTGSARVNLFYGALRGVDKEKLFQLVSESYNEEPLHTLKLIAYIRDCRGGKGERLVGRYALEWLAQNKPIVLKHNLKHLVADFGRFDDPSILMGSPVEEEVLELLQQQLKSDLRIHLQNEDSMENTKKQSISLCAKWIPSEKKSLDKKLHMNKKLAKHMNIQPAELRKVYLSPLRSQLQLLEQKMCANQWEEIEFNHVPSVAMKIHGKPKHAFERHVPEKFTLWKQGLSKGTSKVNAKILFPHEVCGAYFNRTSVDDLLEAQWKVLVEEASKMGDMKKTLVLSDVSGSMSGRPMEVSIALGLLISQLAIDDYKDLVLTFESNPRFHHVKGDNLYERVRNLLNAPWGGSTNFSAAFKQILKLAKDFHLPSEQMPERLIVISDMQFDSADRSFETNYEALKRSFFDAGYDVPHLVFWNVNGRTNDYPTYSGQAKVSLVSGFSTNILKSVLHGEQLTPLSTVLNVVNDERYNIITLPSQDGANTTSEDTVWQMVDVQDS